MGRKKNKDKSKTGPDFKEDVILDEKKQSTQIKWEVKP